MTAGTNVTSFESIYTSSFTIFMDVVTIVFFPDKTSDIQ